MFDIRKVLQKHKVKGKVEIKLQITKSSGIHFCHTTSGIVGDFHIGICHKVTAWFLWNSVKWIHNISGEIWLTSRSGSIRQSGFESSKNMHVQCGSLCELGTPSASSGRWQAFLFPWPNLTTDVLLRVAGWNFGIGRGLQSLSTVLLLLHLCSSLFLWLQMGT